MLATRCQHCQADVSDVPHDRIELPEVKPDVTRVTLHGGRCPCCARRFKAAPPSGRARLAVRPEPAGLCALPALYTAISFERLARLMSDLLGLPISNCAEQHAGRQPHGVCWQASLIASTCCAAPPCSPTNQHAGRQTHGGTGCSIMTTVPVRHPPSRGGVVVAEFLGGFVRITGFPTAARRMGSSRAPGLPCAPPARCAVRD